MTDLSFIEKKYEEVDWKSLLLPFKVTSFFSHLIKFLLSESRQMNDPVILGFSFEHEAKNWLTKLDGSVLVVNFFVFCM